jgi:lipoprotein-anchoring transpeptidase ErfK/SrfK
VAISPNNDFTAGQVLTATECNQFPRGIVARAQSTTTDATITTEEIQLTSGSFTAVADRYYRITYYEPQVQTPSSAGAFVTSSIRLTNLAGTRYQLGIIQNAGGTSKSFTMTTVWVGTLTAGSTVIVATLACSSGTATATRSATAPAQLTVEDIGPA